MKPVIAFDVDGVLADFAWGWRRLAQLEYGTPLYGSGGQQTWEFNDLTPEQQDHLWGRIMASDTFWRLLPALVTKAEAEQCRTLARSHDFIYVTNRRAGVDLALQTKRAISQYGMPAGDLHMVKDKARCLRMYDGRLVGMLEDSPINIRNMRRRKLPVFVRDWPYNREVDGERVGSIAEFLSKVVP